MSRRAHRPPRDCPVCGHHLLVTRLGCRSCGSELSGRFDASPFAALDGEEMALLRVFLASRGNLREVERHLGVSYPTARARFDALLAKLGIEPGGASGEGEPPPDAKAAAAAEESMDDVLDRLARGEIDVDEAERRLA